jgi:lysylphosphatidylglycerol synthetase-like protein (DUF2156 family)
VTLQLPPIVAPLPAGADRPAPPHSRAEYSVLAARYGRTGVAPFVANPDLDVVRLLGGVAASGYARVRRWAVVPGDVIAPDDLVEPALDEYLDLLSARRLRPAFVAVSDPVPYRRRGFDVTEIADEAVIDLPTFGLSGSKRANLRHSTTSARRAGLTVLPYAPWQDPQIEEISQQWLRTKRGGEMGFTLSRHDDVAAQLSDHTADLWVIVDGEGVVQAWCTWRPYLDGQARVVDVMRRRINAPNPAMDCLLVTVLENYRDAGLQQASLASVPRDHGAMADRIYPSRSLRAYKQKFQPRWEPRMLAVRAAWQRPLALAAIGTAYCPGGLRRAVFRNK